MTTMPVDWYDPNRSTNENNKAFLVYMDQASEYAKTLMPPEDWTEFFILLEGPEGCDFKKDENDQTTWKCGGGKDQSLAEGILKNHMNLDDNKISEVLQLVDGLGGHCSCEILFNAAERIDT